ncbi:MAG TPA: hypothetical protein VL181_09645 [Holophagaceae bacterium]|nr:hypothetical protein [Holophagaceae bacterium]
MVEAIQCTSCQTRYGLRPARVRSGLRRAQCFRCGDVFHIELEVKRLLALSESPATTASVPLDTLAEAIAQAPEAQEAAAPIPALESHDLALGDLEIPEPDFGGAPASAPELPAAVPPDEAPTADTMAFDLPPLPTAEEVPAPEPSGTYASAKDAIARLFGDTPLAPSPAEALRGALSQGRDMDMDAGMRALEDTLGGVKSEELSTRPVNPAAFVLPAPSAMPMEEEDLPHAASTLRINAPEMLAAMASPPMPEMPVLPEPPEITQEEVTMVLPPAPGPVSTDPSALRLRIGDQVYTGLDLPTIAKWIEEGRVLEEHQVARGTSETWMDAAKVPALRAVFDRLRRARLGAADLPPAPPSSITEAAPKRGLFGGMFGKKD